MPSSETRLIHSRALWALYALLGLFAFAQNMIGPAVPFLRAEFHLDYGAAAMHMSAFALGQMLSGLAAPVCVRRLGLRRSIWGGMLGMLLGITGFVLAPFPALSLVSILFMSLTGCVSLSCLQTSIAGLAGSHRSQALMEANVAASAMSALAPFVLVAGVALGLGWRVFWPAFALGLAGASLFGARPIAAAVPDAGAEKAAVGRKRLPAAFWKVWALTFIAVGVEWSVGFWATEYLKGLPGQSLSLAAAGAGVFQVAAVAGRLVSSRLMARLKERRMLAVAMVLTLLGFPLYWLRAGALSAIAGLALCGLGVSNFYPLALSLGLDAAEGQTAAASSWEAAAAGAAIFSMPLLLGLVADRAGLSTALLAAPIGLCLMGFLLIQGRKGGR
jgi:fucose permease